MSPGGGDDTAQYVLRTIAAMTQGRYIFLTDDSGIGDAHAEPDVACYQVTALDQLVARALAGIATGRRVEPPRGDVLRVVGSYDRGRCGVRGQAERAAMRLMISYLAAVALASALYAGLTLTPMLIAVWSHVSTEILWTDLSLFPIFGGATFLIATLISFPLLMCAASRRHCVPLADRAYWTMVGGLCGFAVVSVVAYPLSSFSDDGSLGAQWLNMMPKSLLCGLLAGLVFWRMSRTELKQLSV